MVEPARLHGRVVAPGSFLSLYAAPLAGAFTRLLKFERSAIELVYRAVTTITGRRNENASRS
jgi:hypothetical protein